MRPLSRFLSAALSISLLCPPNVSGAARPFVSTQPAAQILLNEEALSLTPLNEHLSWRPSLTADWWHRLGGNGHVAAWPAAIALPPGLPQARTNGRLDAKDISRQLFNRHDGIDLVTPVAALSRFGILALLQDPQGLTSQALMEHLRRQGLKPNLGPWEQAMQLLAMQGWIIREGERPGALRFRLTEAGRAFTGDAHILDAYEQAARFVKTELATVRQLDEFLIKAAPRAPPEGALTYPQAVALAARDWDIPETEQNISIRPRVLEQLNGLLVGITAFTLADRGVIRIEKDASEGAHASLVMDPLPVDEARRCLNRSMTPRQMARALHQVWRHQSFEYSTDPEYLRAAFYLLTLEGWLVPSREGFQLTQKGRLAARSIKTAGVPLSYLPMLAQIDEILVGIPAKVFRPDSHGNERHVNRRINLVGTDAAHHSYFEALCAMLKPEFDKPIDQQPQFIVDVGCGPASALKAVYRFVLENTERGRLIREDPEKYKLLLVGADFFPVARRMARQALSQGLVLDGQTQAIPFEVIPGDINDPAAISREIERIVRRPKYRSARIDPRNGIYISTFLWHNAPFIDSGGWDEPSENPTAYTSYDPRYAERGYHVPAGAVDAHYLRFFERWRPFIERFGLFTAELHLAPDEVAAAHVGRFAAASYWSTHAFSAQYILPLPHLLRLARRAGLAVIETKLFPKGGFAGGHAPTSVLHLRAQSA